MSDESDTGADAGPVASLLDSHGGVMLAQALAITDDAALAERVVAAFCRDLAQSLPDVRGALPADLIAALRERAIIAADQAGFRRVARRRVKGDSPVDFSVLPEADREVLLDAYRLALTETELATRLRMTGDAAIQRLGRAIRGLISYAGLEHHPVEREILAAQYVLGLLRGPARQALVRSRIEDRDVAESINWWQDALAPATRMLAPLPLPPACRDQALGRAPLPPPPGTRSTTAGGVAAAEARTEAAAAKRRARGPSLWSSLAFWRTLCFLIAALAFGLFARIWWTELRPRPSPLPPAAAAALAGAPASGLSTPDSAPPAAPAAAPSQDRMRQVAVLVDFERLPAWLAVLDPATNRLTLSPIRRQEPTPGMVFELWLLDGSGGNPKSLGELTPLGRTFENLPDSAADGAMLALSQEAPGGTAGAAPSLPYLVLGAFVESGADR